MEEPRNSLIATRSAYLKPKWGHRVDHIMSCCAMAVGLGNFWRFPYICYENGGGAFLIPYFIVIVLLGRPMFHLDMAMGQYCGRASFYMYSKLAPGWMGIGITQTMCIMCIISYYAFILAVALYYFVMSFALTLPWEVCKPEWGDTCIERSGHLAKNASIKAKSSAQFYLDKDVFYTLDSIDHGLGTPNWKLCISLAAIWILTFTNVTIGIRKYGKVSYFLTIFPYVVIIALLINTCTLPGSWDGILFLLTPTWSKILAPASWLNAVTQCFFSLNIGSGTISMFSSYSDIHNNLNLVSIVVTVVDTCTSLLCGITVFAGMGHLAHRINRPIEEVYEGDTLSLGFVSYPDAISTFEFVPYIFSVIFFFMLVTLGLGSLCAYMQVATTNLLEVSNMKVWQSSLIISLLGFISGIVYTTPGGFGIVTLVDLFGNVYNLAILAFFQVILIVYFYGLHKWCWDIEYMLSKKVSWFWRYTWAISCPLLLIIICISACIANDTPQYHNNPYPVSALVSAYLLLTIIVIPIPIAMIVVYVIYHKTYRKEAFKEMFTTEHWLPDEVETVEEIKKFNQQVWANYTYADRPKIVKIFFATFKKMKHKTPQL